MPFSIDGGTARAPAQRGSRGEQRGARHSRCAGGNSAGAPKLNLLQCSRAPWVHATHLMELANRDAAGLATGLERKRRERNRRRGMQPLEMESTCKGCSAARRAVWRRLTKAVHVSPKLTPTFAGKPPRPWCAAAATSQPTKWEQTCPRKLRPAQRGGAFHCLLHMYSHKAIMDTVIATRGMPTLHEIFCRASAARSEPTSPVNGAWLDV